MAWTAPRTWVVGEVLTAALLNTHLRDNLLETGPAKATTAGKFLKVAGANSLEEGEGGMKRTTGDGPYLIPAGPAGGTSVSSAASGGTYGAWTEAISAAAADLLVLGVLLENGDAAREYTQIDIGTGTGGNEVSRGEVKWAGNSSAGAANVRWPPMMLATPIFIASGTRIALRAADSSSSAVAWPITLIVVNVSDLEDF